MMSPYGSPLNFGAGRFLQQQPGMPQGQPQGQPGAPQFPQYQQGMTAASMLGLPQMMNQTQAPVPQQYGPFHPQGLMSPPQQPQQQQFQGLLSPFRREQANGGGRQSGGMGGNRSRTSGPGMRGGGAMGGPGGPGARSGGFGGGRY